MNLFEHLVIILKSHNKDISDIQWIGNETSYIEITEFIKIANRINDKYSALELVPSNLKIVGKDFIVEKTNYDDDLEHSLSDCWRYIAFLQKPSICNNKWIDYFDENEKMVLNERGITNSSFNTGFSI